MDLPLKGCLEGILLISPPRLEHPLKSYSQVASPYSLRRHRHAPGAFSEIQG